MKFGELTAPEINAAASKAVALLPIAATEQHGPHLGTTTDSDIVTAIARHAEEALPRQIILCPTMPFGASHHHLGFGGTISLPVDTFALVIVELVKSLLKSGFERIVLLNGHGGNIAPASHALSMLAENHVMGKQPNVALATYWEMANPAFTSPPLESPIVRHACEYETSLMLHLHPERVHLDRVQLADIPTPRRYFDWEREGPPDGVTMHQAFHYITTNGTLGQPHLATADKGAYLFDEAVKATVRFIEQFAQWPLLKDRRPIAYNPHTNGAHR